MYIRYSDEFEWDGRKANTNRRKHGVDFADAVLVMFDERALTMPEQHRGEKRWVTIGADALGRVLVVVYCYRGGQDPTHLSS
jgi:uncharacterized protein